MAKGGHAAGASCGSVKTGKAPAPVGEKRGVGRPATNPKTIARMERAAQGIFLGRGRPRKEAAPPVKKAPKPASAWPSTCPFKAQKLIGLN